ncbi:MAG TPA: glycogen debranching N-terminal domain-containing protein [Candidatus Limnocylindria bacterium]
MSHRIQLRARAGQLFAYSGRSLLVTNLEGELPPEDPYGLFVENARHLSGLEVRANGSRPKPISASAVGGDALLAYAEIPAGGGVPKESVYLETLHFVGDGLRTLLRVTSFAPKRARLTLTLAPTADFADTDEVERRARQQTADVETAWDADAGELTLRYCHPRLDRRTVLSVVHAPEPPTWDGKQLSFAISLPARGRAELELTTEPMINGQRRPASPRRTFAAPTTPAEKLRSGLRDGMTQLTSSNDTVARAWRTASLDLATLPLDLADGAAAPIAGLPIYQQLFGRDMLTIGWQSLPANPALLRDALRVNAAWQGTRIDDWLDEEPGKMIHQAQDGPLAELGETPYRRYYGDWATPPDFLVMLGQYLFWTDDGDTVRRLLPAARAALDWGFRYGDPDGDGFLDYDTHSKKGVKNQGWRDSDDAVIDERGRIVPNPIASSELQAYWYAALQQAALVFTMFGDVGYGAELLREAISLRRRFNAAFWMPDRGAYAMGLGPGKEQIRSIGSNDGHLLASGIVPAKRGRRLAARLMQPDLFSGWGIRTLSAEHAAFNPFSYHRGSVWPVEQGTIGFGFARYGCWELLDRLAEGTFAASDLFVENRLPEVISGIGRDADHPHPGIYPASCEPQGWSASAVIQLVQALLGMVAFAPMGLLVVDPHLPAWLPDLRLTRLRVGEATLDIRFERAASGRTTWRVLDRDGWVRVVRQPPPQAPGSGLVGRLLAGVGSLPRT